MLSQCEIYDNIESKLDLVFIIKTSSSQGNTYQEIARDLSTSGFNFVHISQKPGGGVWPLYCMVLKLTTLHSQLVRSFRNMENNVVCSRGTLKYFSSTDLLLFIQSHRNIYVVKYG